MGARPPWIRVRFIARRLSPTAGSAPSGGLTPVTADGADDASRPVLFVGQAQVMTPMGAVPISFELEATTLSAAIAKFGDAAELAVQQTVRELQELRREQASSLVIPDSAGGGIPAPSDLMGRGRPRR